MNDLRPARPGATPPSAPAHACGRRADTILAENREKTIAKGEGDGSGAVVHLRPLRLVRRGGVIEDLIRREVAAGTALPLRKGVRP